MEISSERFNGGYTQDSSNSNSWWDRLTVGKGPVIIHTMNASQSKASISDVLRRTIVESGVSYNALQRDTGVTRASIMRFVRGDQSIRLDMADRLAEYYGLALSKQR
jgi:Helix-turn-helix